MGRRGRGAGRGAARREQSDVALQGRRPGAERAKSLQKALGPNGQEHVKRATQMAKNGDHAGAARIFQEVAGRLDEAGSSGLAARAMLRAARTLYVGGNQGAALEAVKQAAAYAKNTGNKKAIKTHFRDLIRRVRSGQGEEVAAQVQAAVQEGLGLQRMGRDRGKHRRGQARG